MHPTSKNPSSNNVLNQSDGVELLHTADKAPPDVGPSEGALTPKKRKPTALIFSCVGFFAGLALAALLWAPLEIWSIDDGSPPSFFANAVVFVRGEAQHPHYEQWGLQAEQFKNKANPLNKGQHNLVGFLAKKYRIAVSEVRKMVAAAYSAGANTKQDPLLILAVMSIESNLNPVVESAAGAQGLMQIMPKVHSARFAQYGGVENIFNIDANVLIGARILQDCIKLGGNTVEGGLKCYVGASGPSDGGYGAKVLSARDRLARAAEGDYDFTAPKQDLELKPSTELLPLIKGEAISSTEPQTTVPVLNTTLQLNLNKPQPQ